MNSLGNCQFKFFAYFFILWGRHQLSIILQIISQMQLHRYIYFLLLSFLLRKSQYLLSLMDLTSLKIQFLFLRAPYLNQPGNRKMFLKDFLINLYNLKSFIYRQFLNQIFQLWIECFWEEQINLFYFPLIKCSISLKIIFNMNSFYLQPNLEFFGYLV